MAEMIRAIVAHQPGGPAVLQIEARPMPTPQLGWALVRVRAFGLNRAEMFTRQGHSPSVRFPRVIGIEMVGEIVHDTTGRLQPGQKVASAMGEMGRDYDGSYAEYTCLLSERLMPLDTNLPWATLAAIPEMFFTAYGALTESLNVQAGQILLIRGGTSSVGLLTLSLAKRMGLTVISTTRQPARRDFLLKQGADYVIIDDGDIAPKVHELFPGGVNAVQELVGTASLLDSLRATAPKGTVCFTGILGNRWVLEQFEPFQAIPSSVKLTTYTSDTLNLQMAPSALQQFVADVESGHATVHIDRVFDFEDIVAAHTYMETNQATGKLVVRVG